MQICCTIIENKKEELTVQSLLHFKNMLSLLCKTVVDKKSRNIITKGNFAVFTFLKKSIEKSYDIVKITLENGTSLNCQIHSEAIVRNEVGIFFSFFDLKKQTNLNVYKI